MFLELENKINYEGSLKVKMLKMFCEKYGITLDRYTLKQQSILREVVARGIDKTTFDYYKFNEHTLSEYEFSENYNKFKSNYDNKLVAKKFKKEFESRIESLHLDNFRLEKYKKLSDFLVEKLSNGMEYYKINYFDIDMIVEWAEVIYEDINDKDSGRKIGEPYEMISEKHEIIFNRIFKNNWEYNYEFKLLIDSFKEEYSKHLKEYNERLEREKQKKEQEAKENKVESASIENEQQDKKLQQKNKNDNKKIQMQLDVRSIINEIYNLIKSDLVLKEYYNIKNFSIWLHEKIEKNRTSKYRDLKLFENHLNNFMKKYNNQNISRSGEMEKEKNDSYEESILEEIIIEEI